MAVTDQRDFIIFYGIKYTDWMTTFGKFVDHRGILATKYLHIDCACSEYTHASSCTPYYCVTMEFLFPHHIKKQYYIEGVIQGEFTVACNGGNSQINDYRISVWKTNQDTTFERLAVTYLGASEWISLNHSLTWDAGHSIGQERVYHWYIDCWTAQELKEHDRLFLKVEIRGTNNFLCLMHANDPDWEDIWAKIPFRL